MGNKPGQLQQDPRDQVINIQRRCTAILLKPKSDQPPPETSFILREFEQKLNEIHLPSEQKSWLLSQSIEVKWQLLCKHMETSRKESDADLPAEDIIEEINRNPAVSGIKKARL